MARLPDELVFLYSEMEAEIIELFAEKLKDLRSVTSEQELQAKILATWDRQAVVDIVEKTNKKLTPRVQEIFDKALEKGNESLALTKMQKQLIRQVLEKPVHEQFTALGLTDERIKRLSLTIADRGQTEFIKEATKAFSKTNTGAWSYDDAMKSAVDNLIDNGVKTVQYSASGRQIVRSVESMIRTNILTGVNQVAREQALTQAEVLETNLVEVSAHLGARPDHAQWQGKVYQLEGASKKYPNLAESTRLGDPDGLLGINCRHFFRPYLDGEDLHFSKGELDELKDKTVEYQGKTMSLYEGEQKMRAIERAMREEKKRIGAYKKAGISADSTKYNELAKLAKDFESKTGIRLETTRLYIG
jgi:translation initiation factor 2B subunit (eIF-2B alpha/beta/delta family)